MYNHKDINNNALIIFAVNPIVNAGESSLAEKYLDKEALKKYLSCLKNIYNQTKKLDSRKFLFLDMAYNHNHYDTGYEVCVQYGNNAGMKMYHAFEKIFGYGHGKAVILSADIPDITQDIVQQSFDKLDDCDVIIGPTSDGGFYLLGTKHPSYELFDNMLFNEKTVLENLISNIEILGKSYFLLDELTNAGSDELNPERNYQKVLKSERN